MVAQGTVPQQLDRLPVDSEKRGEFLVPFNGVDLKGEAEGGSEE